MSPNHLYLLSKTMQMYNLPQPIFIESSIAFGVSFGYLSYSSLKSKECVVVVNCGDVFLIVTVIEFASHEMKLLYSKTVQFGGRIFTKLLCNYVLEKENRDNLTSLTRFQLLQHMVKWKGQINTHQVSSTNISIIGAFGDEDDDDLEQKINHLEFEEYCKEHIKLFEEVLNETKKVGKWEGRVKRSS